MSNVNLRIVKTNNQTDARIWMRPNDTLTFHNDSPSDEVLQVQWTGDALREIRDKTVAAPNPLQVPAGHSYSCRIRPDFSGQFEYTVQIGNAGVADPIIIVD